MSRIEFHEFRQQLDHPRPVRLTGTALVEVLHRHTPNEDPQWPTPRLLYEARLLLRRLPRRMQVICGLTLAEMVLPIWEEWAGQHGDVTALRQTVDCLRRWFNGQAGLDELKRSAVSAEQSSDHALDEGVESLSRGVQLSNEDAFDAKSAADAVDHAVYAAYGTRGVEDTATIISLAVDNAAKALSRIPQWGGAERLSALERFMGQWWARCRCRLAFDLPEQAELE